jgi:polysaccharide biosynthesis protein PslG
MARMLERLRPSPAVALAVGALTLLGGCGGGGTKESDKPATTATAPAKKQAEVPSDFIGLVSEDAFAAQGDARNKILAAQEDAGVQLLRQTFDWSKIETAPGRYVFDYFDVFVKDAARHGITILPILFNPPPFHSSSPTPSTPGPPTYPPKDYTAMASFATVLVQRYGSKGSFWKEQPADARKPIRSWQVWNEPNLPAYWGKTPKAVEYTGLLREVGAAIKKADPDATVVTGGIPNSKLGIPFTEYVKAMFRAGAKGTFDALAIHPYSKTEDGVLLAVADARRLLDSLGAKDTELWVTEFGWASGGPGSQFTVPEAAQAEYVSAAIRDFARRRKDLGLHGFVYFNWRDAPPYVGGKDFWGLHTGLLKIGGEPKPARQAFGTAATGVE